MGAGTGHIGWRYHMHICSFTADFWKDKWQNWKDSLTSGKTDNTTAYFLFASEADYQSKLSRILTERIFLWNLSDVKWIFFFSRTNTTGLFLKLPPLSLDNGLKEEVFFIFIFIFRPTKTLMPINIAERIVSLVFVMNVGGGIVQVQDWPFFACF